ncbi:MAG: type II CRISPR RNA-guided endonuclease Cas9 [Bacteroidales bacterium]|nr:type II CRISPR RNA-guided endonuclease Cas9 [Bacteroidales bacterium]
MAKILGLDLGTNSIGWAVVDDEKKNIVAAGSRIIPMDGGTIGDFERGNSVSQTEDRTRMRGARRLRERFLLRRERLVRVLNLMDFLPEHYASTLDRYGHLPEGQEPKLAWREGKDGKMEFLFRSSFEEMVADLRRIHPDLKCIPYDWTIYYLRQKALSQPISKEELSWVLMQFNQKRGYNQLRGKDDSDEETAANKEYKELLVTNVEDTGETSKDGKHKYAIHLENGWIYYRTSATALFDWKGKRRPFIATFKVDKEGNRNDVPSLSSPQDGDWGLRKIKTEQDIADSGLTLGQYIYNILRQNPDQKIIGEAVRVVDREYYRKELHAILAAQSKFHSELCNKDLLMRCIEELYPNNDAHRRLLSSRTFEYLLAEDILLYQRPLKSKRSLIADCPYEKRNGKAIKCIAKSHPLFQEFRMWQWLSNLRIYQSQGARELDVTDILLPDDNAWTSLFDQLMCLKSIEQKDLLNLLGINKKSQQDYRWNYPEDNKYPAGETRAVLLDGLKKAGIDATFLTEERELIPKNTARPSTPIPTKRELDLWHLLYSVDDTKEYCKALRTYAHKEGLDEDSFEEAFRKLTVCKEKDYGAYSAKALSRLLPLMRRGRYWSAAALDPAAAHRVECLATGEVDKSLPDNIRSKLTNIQSIDDCRGLSTWQACCLVYGPPKDLTRWEKPEDIDDYLNAFRQHSLNNPIVEQVVTESLRVVRDIWQKYGRPDEIHIEMGRELKKTKGERERMAKQIQEGEKTNQRIRLLLEEMTNPDFEVEGVRPYSPSQQELLKIYEEGVLLRYSDSIDDEIKVIKDKMSNSSKQPSHSEILRYKLWLDQNYISPYTGRAIPLSKLFTSAYQIEHIIPQSIYFDDSLSNKVVCEAEVNQLKDRQLGHTFIATHHGETVRLSMGGTVKIQEMDAYEKLCENNFKGNRKKLEKLMLDDIPQQFINRQLNDSRYISRLMMRLMSNIVREENDEGEREAEATSKHVIATNGAITDRLKHDWGLDDVWNRIVLPRFERLNTLTGTTAYTTLSAEGHTIPSMPLEQRQGFSKKRIDHRHHAMDAIVIACCTRSHINLLNNEAANSSTRHDLQRKLRRMESYKGSDGQTHWYAKEFLVPWPDFAQQSYNMLANMIVSFKQNLRVINKTSNHYTAYDTSGKKKTFAQTTGDSWSIRKPLHKDTIYGEVNLQMKRNVKLKEAFQQPERIVDRELRAKVKELVAEGLSIKQLVEYFEKHADVWSETTNGKVEVYYYTKETKERYFATRKELVDYMKDCKNEASARKAIEAITDSGIRKIMMAHLNAEGGNAEEAFNADGLERMNANITALNDGHPHMPIKHIREYTKGEKFSVGTKGINPKKYVNGAKGTNLLFIIYRTPQIERAFDIIELRYLIECQKKYKKEWRNKLESFLKEDHIQKIPQDASIIYTLSPHDLVYLPSLNDDSSLTNLIDNMRLYRVVSVTESHLDCIPHSVAKPIFDKVEFSSQNKMQKDITGEEMIKERCIPIKVDRLGNIISIG